MDFVDQRRCRRTFDRVRARAVARPWVGCTMWVACFMGAATDAVGQNEWAQFRGPRGLGIAAADNDTPVEFDVDRNLIWKRELAAGHSSPCVWDQRIFLTGHTADQRLTFCIERTTGEILWRRAVPASSPERTHQLNGQATPTPTTDGERVYVYFGSYGLVCYDDEGREVWTRPLPPVANQFGTAASPILAGNRLIFCSDMKTDSFLEAIDRETGESVWRTERSRFKSGWSSPVHWSRGGVDEIVVYGDWWLTAYDLADGTERWSLPGLTDEPCITPVTGEGLIYVTSYNMKTNPEVIGLPEFADLLKQYDQDRDDALSLDEVRTNKSVLSRFDADGEGDHPLTGFFRYLDVDRSGAITELEWAKMIEFVDSFMHENALLAIRPGTKNLPHSEIVWRHERGIPECPSPLYYESRIYLVKNGGIISCLDAATGELKYQGRLGPGGPYYASPVVCAGKIYVASVRGVVTVLEAGDRLNILARNDLRERIMATPALADGRVYVRTEKALYAFGE